MNTKMKTNTEINKRIQNLEEKINLTKARENRIVYRCLINELLWVLGEEKWLKNQNFIFIGNVKDVGLTNLKNP